MTAQEKDVTVSEGVTRVAKHLRITQGQWEDMVMDPVMACWILLGIKLDAFQACRLRVMWWTQKVIDSSGVGSGKTIVDWVFMILRGILIPGNDGAIFYPSMGTGIESFWDYFGRAMKSDGAKHYRAQLGNPLLTEPGDKIDGDGTTHGSECYTCYFRNGNKLRLPAPSIALNAVRAASLTVHTLVIEEWPQIDAMSDAIDKQLIDRSRGASWNQFHPIWGNHIVLTGHAQTRLHPSAGRYYSHQRKVEQGDPNYFNITFSYKDFSDLPSDEPGKSFKQHRRNEMSINAARDVAEKSAWLGRGYGIWGISGAGWFSEEHLTTSRSAGAAQQLLPVLSRPQWEEMEAAGHRN